MQTATSKNQTETQTCVQKALEILKPENIAAEVQAWASFFRNNQDAILSGAAEIPAGMLAYMELPNYGPANDYDGRRSTALAIKWRVEMEILFPAQAAKNAKQ